MSVFVRYLAPCLGSFNVTSTICLVMYVNIYFTSITPCWRSLSCCPFPGLCRHSALILIGRSVACIWLNASVALL